MLKCPHVFLTVPFQWMKHSKMPSQVPMMWTKHDNMSWKGPSSRNNVVKCPIGCPSSGQNTVNCPLGSFQTTKCGEISSRVAQRLQLVPLCLLTLAPWNILSLPLLQFCPLCAEILVKTFFSSSFLTSKWFKEACLSLGEQSLLSMFNVVSDICKTSL